MLLISGFRKTINVLINGFGIQAGSLSTMNLEEFIIPETASLEDAMEIINANHHGFVLGLNGSGHVVGFGN